MSEVVDVTVDGADEVDPQLNGIKGGGGALLMEKNRRNQFKDCIWIVDESKQVATLGAFKLPVEVVQYGAENLSVILSKRVTILISVTRMINNGLSPTRQLYH